jgi:glycerophosphoryl diester phosphodiesterase
LKLIAHRGLWDAAVLPNSYTSFELAFEHGFGIETDFRDFNGELVVSHDPPTAGNYVTADDFFKLAAKFPLLPLAINIKADGLQDLVKKYLTKYNITNYFVFDMSVPDMYRYQQKNMVFYTRKSEYEEQPCLLKEATGIWLDAFASEWYKKEELDSLLALNKDIAIVSAELHKRDYKSQWQLLSGYKGNTQFKNLFLCTDYPKEAKLFFEL